MKTGLRLAVGTLALGLAVVAANLAAPARAQQEAKPAGVLDYAEKMSRLIAGRKMEDLDKLELPKEGSAAKLGTWRSEYLDAIKKSDAQRDKQYGEAIAKAQDLYARRKLDEATDKLVAAYQIARNQDAFLKLDWVQELTGKVEARAKELEGNGQWLESLQLYSDLNSLFELSTKYKPDMQRLARRTRLLAMYTPKTLYEMRKALLAKQEREKDATKEPEKEDETPSFPRWQDHVEGVTLDMSRDAIDRAVSDWVEKTSYRALFNGGAQALRLFLTTPELAKEFPQLKDEEARKTFDTALDAAIDAASAQGFGSTEFSAAVQQVLEVNDKSIKLPRAVAIMEFTDGAMERLDPFSAVIWPHEVAEFDKNTRGSFGGVGIQISQENGQLKVISPLEDTPAFKAGIMAGDVITAINGKSTVGISIDQAVRTIMGEPGTSVTLRIKREGQTEQKEYKVVRANIKVGSIKGTKRDLSDPENPKWNFMLDAENKIGYIRITGFQEDTARDLERSLEALQGQGMRGLIIDVRFNPGGLLKGAVDISDMFLEQGVIVSTEGRTLAARDHVWRAHKDVVVPNTLPIVVLINQYSASASEIFSGAMKDHHRALLVGQRTFGKGSVQNLIPIGRRGAEALMKLTMSYYLLPNKESIHRRDGARTWGVDPDVQVELTPKQLAELIKQRRDAEIIRNGHTPATAPGTAPATTQKEPVIDTQLDTALLMLRLQLVGLRT